MAYKKKDFYDEEVTSSISEMFSGMINTLGEDASREGLVKTPDRAAKAMQFLTQGYQQDAGAILKSALFKEDYNEMVVVKDIELYSLCEHHLLPFFGKAHVAYIPNGYVVGLSKIPRVIDVFARRLQIQERMTTQIVQALDSHLKPKGIAILVTASHNCMAFRGVVKEGACLETSHFSGSFKDSQYIQNQFWQMVKS